MLKPPPNNFENNFGTSHLSIKCIVLYCLKNNCPPPSQQLLPVGLPIYGRDRYLHLSDRQKEQRSDQIGWVGIMHKILTICHHKIAWIERYFYTILYARFDRVALEVLSLLCTFENSSKCIITSFDSDSFPE